MKKTESVMVEKNKEKKKKHKKLRKGYLNKY